MLFWLLHLISLLYTCEANQITIIKDSDDEVTTPIIETLNISLVFYKSFHKINEQIKIDVLHLYSNSTLKGSQLESSDFVISLVKNRRFKDQIMAISERINLPTIQTHLSNWKSSVTTDIIQSKTGNYVELVPSYVVFNSMLPDLINQLGIRNEFVVIYDEKYQNSMEHDWFVPFRTLNVPVRFEHAEKSPQFIKNHLGHLRLTTKVLLFITETLVVESYVAAQSEIEANLWKWVVFTKDQSPFKCSKCENAQIFWISLAKSTNNEVLSKFAEFIWPVKLEQQFLIARESRHQLRTAYCLDIMYDVLDYLIGLNKRGKNLYGISSQNMTVVDILERNVDHDFGPFVSHNGNLYYQSTRATIIRVDRMSQFKNAWINKYIANWTLENGVHSFYPEKLHVNVRQLAHYRIVIILHEPYIQNDGPMTTFGFRGFCMDLLEILQKELNFTYELYLVPDKKFGRLDQTGIWNGMIGELMSGQADIALGPISVTNQREKDVDFTKSYYDSVGTTIMMRKKEPGYSLFKFIMVLEWPVWLCIFGSCLFISALHWIFDRFSPYSLTNRQKSQNNSENLHKVTFMECLWFSISAFTLQGAGDGPRNISGRLVAMTWWIFGFIAIASYTANLAVFLAVSRMEKQITGLDDLANQYNIQYAPLKDSSIESYFRRMAKVEEKFYEYDLRLLKKKREYRQLSKFFDSKLEKGLFLVNF